MSDFSFGDCSRRPRRADVKESFKNYQGPTTSGENAIRKYHFGHTFFKFCNDDDLNLCRYLNPDLSSILGRYCTFECGTLFGGIKLIELYPTKVPHTKVQYLPIYREAKSRNLLSHNGTYSTAVDLPVCTRLLNLVPVATY